MGEARPLFKVDKVDGAPTVLERRLQRRLLVERRLRKAAEDRAKLADANSKRFHALLIQARVELINKKETK